MNDWVHLVSQHMVMIIIFFVLICFLWTSSLLVPVLCCRRVSFIWSACYHLSPNYYIATPYFGQFIFGGKKVYTKGVFSSESSSASTGKKRGLVYTKKLVFKGERRKIHIHQRAFTVVVGDPFARYWCIDFGLLYFGCRNVKLHHTNCLGILLGCRNSYRGCE